MSRNAHHPRTTSKQTKLALLASVAIAAAAAVVYGPAIGAPFLFDDGDTVVNNCSIVRLLPLIGDSAHPGPLNPPIDSSTAGRPLVNLSLALNYQFSHLNSAGYQLVNLVLHVLTALLLMAIVERTLGLEYFEGRFDRAKGLLAFSAALVWALHPLQTETVIYVTQRTELMVGFFYLATVYCSLRCWAAEDAAARNPWLGLAIAACLAGMACKEVMVSAPVIVLLFERTFLTGSFRKAWRKSKPLYMGLSLGWILLFYLNYSAPRSDSAGFHLGVPAYVWWFTQAKVLLMYLKLAVWPWPLAIHYDMPYLTTFGDSWPWLALAALAGIVTLVLICRRSAIGFVGALGACNPIADTGGADCHGSGRGTTDVSSACGAGDIRGGGRILAIAPSGAAGGAGRRFPVNPTPLVGGDHGNGDVAGHRVQRGERTPTVGLPR